MKNRNMKQKITIAFGAVVICFFVTVGALFYGMINISTQYNQFYKNNHEAIVRVDKVKIYMLATIQNLTQAMIDDDPPPQKHIFQTLIRIEPALRRTQTGSWSVIMEI